MFGYVKTFAAELKIKEYEYYRAAYCGLCRSMGKCTGQCSRLGLDYDFVYLSLIRLVLEDSKPEFELRRCMLHPLKKKSSMVRNPHLEYSARTGAILTHLKISDDCKDEKGLKKILALFLKPFSSHMLKRAKKSDPSLEELETVIRKKLDSLYACECEKSVSVDMPADIFGEILAEIFAFGISDQMLGKIAYSLGFHTGKWIYIADALDDMKEDAEKKNYNPFLLLYGGNIPNAAGLQNIEAALKNEFYSLENAMDLLDFGDNMIAKNILYNIIYFGIPAKANDIMKKYLNCRKVKQKGQNNNE